MFWNKFTFSGKYFGEETVQKRKHKVMSSFSFVGKNVFCLCNFKETVYHVKTIKEEQLACFCLHTGFVLTDSEHSLEECRAGQR